MKSDGLEQNGYKLLKMGSPVKKRLKRKRYKREAKNKKLTEHT